jgi:hypothetical protein
MQIKYFKTPNNMTTEEITTRVKQQLLDINSDFNFESGDKDTLDFYNDCLQDINKVSFITGFQIGVNTGTPYDPQCNLTIITLDNLKIDQMDQITQILKNYEPDGYQWLQASRIVTLLVIEFPY